jgi:hypothetical protein
MGKIVTESARIIIQGTQLNVLTHIHGFPKALWKEIGTAHKALETGQGLRIPDLVDYTWASQLVPQDLRRLGAFVCHAARYQGYTYHCPLTGLPGIEIGVWYTGGHLRNLFSPIHKLVCC